MIYTKDNPKLVRHYYGFKDKKTFTGVVKDKNDTVVYFFNGQCHREDGAAIEYHTGSKEWFLNGKCHREDGPAVEYCDGGKSWYLNGKRHRENGPAVEYASGYKNWHLNGTCYGVNDDFTNESWIRFVQLEFLK